MKIKDFIKDYIWWYKKQAPKYGYFRSMFDCLFNAMHFNFSDYFIFDFLKQLGFQ